MRHTVPSGTGRLRARVVVVAATIVVLLAAGVGTRYPGGAGSSGTGNGSPPPPGYALLHGRVVDDYDRPVAGALVRDPVSGSWARTTGSGAFKLFVPRGQRTLTASRRGYAPETQVHDVASSARTFDFTLWPLAPGTRPITNSADRIIFWVGCNDLAQQTDAQLANWRRLGAGGFVCMINHLRGLGGSNDFTPDGGTSLSQPRYRQQLQLIRSRVVSRARRLGMPCYLGFFASSTFNAATPFSDWFDDRAWRDSVLPRVRDLAGAAKRLGFAGLALDQELYDHKQTASWDWNYPGNRHSESSVREAARSRGVELMRAILSGFPGVELVAYGTQLPGSWEAHVRMTDYATPDAFAGSVQPDVWDGITSVPGYHAIRWLDAFFYKSTQSPTQDWDRALQYDARGVYSLLSQRFSGWSYASSRLHLSPFAWIDSGPSAYEAARPPAHVAGQLAAFRRWGTGRTFGTFLYRGLSGFDYRPYGGALRQAATPGTVDTQPPSLAITSPAGSSARGSAGKVDLAGTATDNFAVRVIRWRDERGRSGVARMAPDDTTQDGAAVTWTIAGVPVPPGGTRVWVRVEDIKGLSTLTSVSISG